MISFEVAVQSISNSQLTYVINYNLNDLKLIKLSMLLFQNDWPYINDIKSYSFSGNANTAFYASSSLFLFTQLLYATTSSSYFTISYSTSYSQTSSTNYQLNLGLSGSYDSFLIRIRILAINNVYFNSASYPIKYYPFTFSTNSGTGYSFSTSITNYVQNTTGHLFGLGSFSFVTSASSYSICNFKINTDFLSATNIQVTNSNQFTTLYYLIINFYSYGCPNPNFPVRLINGAIDQCYQYCPVGYYQIYSLSYRMNICQLCTITNCLQCKANNYCTKCIDHYIIVTYPLNTACVLNSSYYINAGVIYDCNLNIDGCQACMQLLLGGATLPSCFLCKQGYIRTTITSGHFTCKPCSFYVPNCVKCRLYLGSIVCQSCILPYILLNQTNCSLTSPDLVVLACFDSNCLRCKQTNPNSCLQCKYSNYVLLFGVCRQIICGDYKIDPIQSCDDGNNLNFDGCSSKCKIQPGYHCLPKLLDPNVPDIWVSDCYFTNQIKLKVLSINKYVDQNKVKIILKNPQPNIKEWASFTQQAFSHIIKFDVPRISSSSNHYKYKVSCKFISILKHFQYFSHSRILQQSLDDQNFIPLNYQYLELEIEYMLINNNNNYESLNHQIARVEFWPYLSNLQVFRSNLQQSLPVKLISTNNEVIQYYTQQYHSFTQLIYLLSIGISMVVCLQMILGIVIMFVEKRNSRAILIALESAFVVQLTYYSISGIGQLNPLFLTMAEGLKYSSGYDVKLTSNDNIVVQNNYPNRQQTALGSETIHLSDNLNISISFILAFLLIGSGLLLISKLKKDSQQIDPQQQNINNNNNNNDNQNNQNNQNNNNQNNQNKQNKYNNQNFNNQKNQKNQKNQNNQNNQNENNKMQSNTDNNNEDENISTISTPNSTHNIQSSISLSSIIQLSSIFLYNFTFCFFLFFLYKILIFSFFQLQSITSSQLIDYLILCLSFLLIIMYFIVLYKKIQMFNTLTDKIKFMNRNDIMKQQLDLLENSERQQNKMTLIDRINMNIKRIYLYSFIIQHIINSIIIVFISQLFICWNIIPLIIHITYIFFTSQSQLYNQPNKIRLFINHFISILIQLIFMIRHINVQNIQTSVGGQQNNFGIYLPFSVIGLLCLSVGANFVYFWYSVKKIRCCVLEADWEKIDKELAKRLEVMKELQQERQINLNQVKQNINIQQNQVKQQKLFETNQFQALQRQQINHQNELDQTNKHLQVNPLLSYLINLNLAQKIIKKPQYQTKNQQKQTINEVKWPQIQQKQLFKQIKLQIKQTLMRSKFTPFGDSLQRTIAELKKQKQKLKSDKYQYTNRKLYITDEEYDNI